MQELCVTLSFLIMERCALCLADPCDERVEVRARNRSGTAVVAFRADRDGG